MSWRPTGGRDRKSTRLNSSHVERSYAVFCLKKKNKAKDFPVLVRSPAISLHPPQNRLPRRLVLLFFFNDTATTEIYTLSLHDALPISALPTEGSATTSRSSRTTASAP